MSSNQSALYQKLQNGVAPAMATPLSDDGYHVREASILPLVDFLVERGVASLFVGGTTGEGILLQTGERLVLHENVVQATAGRVPVLVHVGANDLATATTLARHAAEIAVDAIVAVAPYFYPIHEDGLLAYFAAIAAAAPETPLLLYDIPHMAVNGISPQLLRRVAAEVPTFGGVKTSHADAQHVRRLIDVCPEHALVLAGNESIALGTLALGANGLISGLSTAIPEPFVALTRAFARGDIQAARKAQSTVNRLLALLPAGARIGAIKHILSARGVPAGPPVPPRPAVTDDSLWPSMEAILEQGETG